MNRRNALRGIAIFMATVLTGACAGSTSPSPSARSLVLADVTAALAKAGIDTVDVVANLNPRDGAWQCLPGPFALARVSQQPAGVIANPGGKPSVDVLIFPTLAARESAQATIGSDGQVHVQGCAAMVDWIGTPHAVGVSNVILFVSTDDPAMVSAVQAAADELEG